MPLNFISGGSSAPTGIPIPVADDAERLSMEPPEGTHVKQESDGITWVVFEGNWRKAQPLLANTSPSQVESGAPFQSDSYPNLTYGTLEVVNVTSTNLLPAQAFADNMEKFAMRENPLTLTGVAFLGSALYTKWLEHCISVLGQPPELYANGSALTNVADILNITAFTYQTLTPVGGGDFHFVNANAERISPFNVHKIELEDHGCAVQVRYTVPNIGTVDAMGWADQSSNLPQTFNDGLGNLGLYFPPSTTGITATNTNMSDPVALNLDGLDSLTSVSLTNAVEISSISNPPDSLQSVVGSGGGMQTLNLSNLPNLNALNFTSASGLTSVRVENCPLLTGVYVDGGNLDSDALDQLILDIHGNAVAGALNGTLNTSGQTTMATPTAAVATEFNELSAIYGWTVTT